VKAYLVSLAVGILVGGIHALLRVRSPAPPVVALAGLLGILIGEQGVGTAAPRPAAEDGARPRGSGAAVREPPLAVAPSRNL
jgi:XapX domain-containing protein